MWTQECVALCWNRKLVAPLSYAPTSHVAYVWAVNIWKPLAPPACLVRPSYASALPSCPWVGVGRCAHQLVLWAWEDLTLVASVVLAWQLSDGAPGQDNCLLSDMHWLSDGSERDCCCSISMVQLGPRLRTERDSWGNSEKFPGKIGWLRGVKIGLLLAPKVLLEDLWPMIIIQPIHL